MLLSACGSEAPRNEGAKTDPASRFGELERRLTAADTVRFTYRVTAQGAVDADIAGEVTIDQAEFHVTGSGQFAGQDVEVFVRGDGDTYELGNQATRDTLSTPVAMAEALLIGFTRMGILHNLARLTAAAPPDHADGGVREWVTVDAFATDPADPAGLTFNLTVDGEPSGSASLEIGPTGLPVVRRQNVQVPTGEMRVEERYSGVTIRPKPAPARAHWASVAPPRPRRL
jgi:hypothetical protein